MSNQRNPAKQNRGRGSESSRPAFAKRTKTKSRSASHIKPVGIFRPDLLDYNPIEKSGYSSLKIDLPEHEQFDAKIMLVTEWHKCLKRHEDYQPILIDSESTIDVAFQLLHRETERLFKGYNWMFMIPDEQTPQILYYESLGDVNNYNLPLDWLYLNKNIAVRNASLWLMKQLSEHFGIELIANDTLEMCYENWRFDEDDDHTVVSYVREQLDDGNPECKLAIYEAVANIYSYKYGKPKELKDLLKGMMWTYDDNEFRRAVIDNCDDEEMRDWLLSGHKLLSQPPVHIREFELNPEDMNNDNGEPVQVSQSVFFPYSIEDYVYKEYEGWLDSIANGIGRSDFYNFGIITAQKHSKPELTEPLYELLNFIEQGQKIYKNH